MRCTKVHTHINAVARKSEIGKVGTIAVAIFSDNSIDVRQGEIGDRTFDFFSGDQKHRVHGFVDKNLKFVLLNVNCC